MKNFAYCDIRFNGNDYDEDVIIALKPMEKLGFSEDDENDDEVFFYCQNEDELKDLCKKDNGEDFYITKIKGYFNEL